MAWEDLLQEALYRTFAGRRLWPLDVNFVAFLAQTMRSIASEERKRMALEPVEYESDLRNEDDTLDLSGLAVDTRTPESEAMARAALKQIDQMFSSDQEALHILRGLAEGLTPAETQAMAGMTGNQYANTQKRIQRALSRKFGKDINA
jgi:DNA-directed RNA polymerase specialized sigma24 family protein